MQGSARPLRAGVIGCGFFSYNQLHAWHELAADVALAAVCDADAARAKRAAEEYGVPAWYDDAEEMLRAVELDFVDIITTPPSHRALVELAARHGVPVICQKPMAFELHDARAMVDACRAADVPFMVHENFRWQPPMRAIKGVLDRGAVGRPFFARFSWRTHFDVFANQPYLAEETRLIVADLGVHMLDLARFYLGEPRALTCQNLRVRPDIKGEDAATVLLQFDNASCVVDFSYSSYAAEDPFPQVLARIEGAEGTVDIGPGYRLTVARADGTVEDETLPIPRYGWTTPPWDVVQESVVAIQRHWADCLRSGRTPETSGEDNLRTLELVERAYASAASGATVDARGAPA